MPLLVNVLRASDVRAKVTAEVFRRIKVKMLFLKPGNQKRRHFLCSAAFKETFPPLAKDGCEFNEIMP